MPACIADTPCEEYDAFPTPHSPKRLHLMADPLLQLLLYLAMLVGVGAGWVLTVVSLPGNWLILATAGVYAWLTPEGTRWDIGLPVLGVLLGLAVVGEIVEALASAAGVKKVGGSKRGAVLAVVGSVIGAIVGTGAIPIPAFGTIFGACLGALVGAVVGELWKGRDIDHTLRVGQAAFWGRLVGSLAKIIVASAMVAVTVSATLLN